MTPTKPYVFQPKPVLARPVPAPTEPVAVKPQAVPYAGKQADKVPASTAPSVNSTSPKPGGSTAVAVTKPVAQTAASSPAAAIQFSDPLQKPADTTVDNPPRVPDSAPGK